MDSTISKSKAGAVHVSMGLDLVVVSPIRLLRIVVRCLPLLNSRAIVHGHGCLPLPNYSYAYVVVGLVFVGWCCCLPLPGRAHLLLPRKVKCQIIRCEVVGMWWMADAISKDSCRKMKTSSVRLVTVKEGIFTWRINLLEYIFLDMTYLW